MNIHIHNIQKNNNEYNLYITKYQNKENLEK